MVVSPEFIPPCFVAFSNRFSAVGRRGFEEPSFFSLWVLNLAKMNAAANRGFFSFHFLLRVWGLVGFETFFPPPDHRLGLSGNSVLFWMV